MAIHHIQKDGKSSRPNTVDTVLNRKAHNTVSTTYSAPDSPINVPVIKMDNNTIVLKTIDNTSNVTITGAGITGYSEGIGTTFNLPSDGSAPAISGSTLNNTNQNLDVGSSIKTSDTVGDGTTDSAGILIDNTGMYAFGSEQDQTNANVRILSNGDAYFAGELTAATGTFIGSVTASTGEIGGFTIGATDLSATAGGNTTTLSSGTTAFSAGPTGAPTILIGQDGSLTATSAIITGEITTATGSQLGGQYIVNNTVDYTALDVASFASLSAITANMGDITAGTITLDTVGNIKGGLTDYQSEGNGFFLGQNAGVTKFSVGKFSSPVVDTDSSFSWDGVMLYIKGKISTTTPLNIKNYATVDLPIAASTSSAKSPSSYA